MCFTRLSSCHLRGTGFAAAFRPLEFTKDVLISPLRILHRFATRGLTSQQSRVEQATNKTLGFLFKLICCKTHFRNKHIYIAGLRRLGTLFSPGKVTSFSDDHVIIILLPHICELTLFTLPFLLCTFPVLVLILVWVRHSLHRIIVHLEAESNSLVERLLRFA